jgi:Tfp pilus assembly protein PilF
LIRNLEALLAQGRDSAHLRFALATQYFQTSDLDKALEHAEVAVELDADYSAAWRLLGQINVARGANREAASAYERGIAVAERRGDQQVAREMRVFLKRLEKEQ